MFNRYHDDIYRIVASAIHNQHDAEDILQNTFVICIQDIKKVKEPAKLKNWLIGIARICMFNYLKEKKRIVFDSMTVVEGKEMPEEYDQEIETRNLDLEDIYKLIDKLQSGHQFIFKSRYFDELSFQEIADILGFKINTIRIHYMEARRELQKLITQFKKENVA